MKKKKSSLGLLVLLLLALAAGYYYLRHRPAPDSAPGPPVTGPVSGQLVVHFLDIGQGDCQLIQLPDGKFILLDSGDSGAPTVELLKRYGVREIELAIATHPHQDHIGEMRDVMRAFTVKEFWDSGFAHSTRTYANMLEEIKARKIPFSTPKRGESRRFGQVLVEVVHPGPQPVDKNPNNDSLSVRVTFGSKSFLFTGDSEEKAWAQMIATGASRLRADLLKAAHHGSSNGTTQAVMDAVRPSIVTISCAVGNDYHHPHPKVVDLLEKRQSAVRLYRTDLHGTISAACDGATINVTTEKQVSQAQLYLTGDEVAGSARSAGEGPTGESQRARAVGAR